MSSDDYSVGCQENKQIAPAIVCKQQADSPEYNSILYCTEKIQTQPENIRLSRKRYSSKLYQYEGENTAMKRICIEYRPDSASSKDEYSIKSDLTFKEHSTSPEVGTGVNQICINHGINCQNCKEHSTPTKLKGSGSGIKCNCINHPIFEDHSTVIELKEANTGLKYSCINHDINSPTFKEHSTLSKLKEASSSVKHTHSNHGIAYTSYVQSQINFGHTHTNVSASQNTNLEVSPYSFRIIVAENLNLKYAKIFSKGTADLIFHKLEKEVEYFPNELSKVKVYGKWHNIPRKQVAYGDSGLSYAFSGTCVPAVAWSKCNIVMHLKEIVESVCKHSFNFVLINRYKNGKDHMGEHRDDEKDLVASAPIASLSFGQVRDFVFRHKDARGAKCKRKMDPITLQLEHGSLLLMESPTNHFWYHSLPVRAKAPNIRINLTFREMVKKN